MKMTSTHRWLFTLHSVMGLFCAARGIACFFEDAMWPALGYLILAGASIWRGVCVYQNTWVIDNEQGLYHIYRNDRLIFEGGSSDLLAVTADCDNMYLHRVGKNQIVIPRSVQNDALLQLYRAKNGKC